MKKLTKYEAERLGHIDGERYAMRWLEANASYEGALPVKEEIEHQMVSRAGTERIEDSAHAIANRDRDIDPHHRSRGWYVAAFLAGAKRELNRAYLEAEWSPDR